MTGHPTLPTDNELEGDRHMRVPIKVELFDLGPHNGMGEPDAEGSYHAFTLAEKGSEGDWPQSLTFMVPAHQLPTRADLCDPAKDERVQALVAAVDDTISVLLEKWCVRECGTTTYDDDILRHRVKVMRAAMLRACKGRVGAGRKQAYQAYCDEVTPNGNTRIVNATLCAGPDEQHQRHISAQMDMAFQAGWTAAIDLAPASSCPLGDDCDLTIAYMAGSADGRRKGWNEALEAAAYVAVNACLVPPDGGSPTEDERLVCEEAYKRIRALKKGPTDD